MRYTLAFAYILLTGASGSIRFAHAAERHASTRLTSEPWTLLMNSGTSRSLLPRGSSIPAPKRTSDRQAAARKATERTASEQPPSKKRKTTHPPKEKDPLYKVTREGKPEMTPDQRGAYRASQRAKWHRHQAKKTDEEREAFRARKRQYNKEWTRKAKEKANGAKGKAAAAHGERRKEGQETGGREVAATSVAHQDKASGPNPPRRSSRQRQQPKYFSSSSSDGSSSDNSSAKPGRSPAHRVVNSQPGKASSGKSSSGKSDPGSEEARASTGGLSDGRSRSPSVLVDNVLPVPPDELHL